MGCDSQLDMIWVCPEIGYTDTLSYGTLNGENNSEQWDFSYPPSPLWF